MHHHNPIVAPRPHHIPGVGDRPLYLHKSQFQQPYHRNSPTRYTALHPRCHHRWCSPTTRCWALSEVDSTSSATSCAVGYLTISRQRITATCSSIDEYLLGWSEHASERRAHASTIIIAAKTQSCCSGRTRAPPLFFCKVLLCVRLTAGLCPPINQKRLTPTCPFGVDQTFLRLLPL